MHASCMWFCIIILHESIQFVSPSCEDVPYTKVNLYIIVKIFNWTKKNLSRNVHSTVLIWNINEYKNRVVCHNINLIPHVNFSSMISPRNLELFFYWMKTACRSWVTATKLWLLYKLIKHDYYYYYAAPKCKLLRAKIKYCQYKLCAGPANNMPFAL